MVRVDREQAARLGVSMQAVNDALNRSRSMTEQAMSSITGGMNIPGLF